MSDIDELQAERAQRHHRHHRHHHHKKDNNTVPHIEAYKYKGDGSDMRGEINHPLYKMDKPKYETRGAEKFMRDHLLEIFVQPPNAANSEIHIETTAEHKRVKKVERAAADLVEKSQRAMAKAKEKEESKSEKMKKFLSTVTKYKMDTKMLQMQKEKELQAAEHPHPHQHHRSTRPSIETGPELPKNKMEEEKETEGEDGKRKAKDGLGLAHMLRAVCMCGMHSGSYGFQFPSKVEIM
jgi:hypothetical protein